MRRVAVLSADALQKLQERDSAETEFIAFELTAFDHLLHIQSIADVCALVLNI